MKNPNRIRANRAIDAINTHRIAHYGPKALNSAITDEEVIDLITDCLHVCSMKKINVESVIRMSVNNHAEETKKRKGRT